MDGNNSDLLTVLQALKVRYNVTNYSEWSSTDSRGTSMMVAPRIFSKKSVPNVSGMSARDAVYLIERLGMHVILRGYGKVKSQTVPAGSPAYKGGLIELVLE